MLETILASIGITFLLMIIAITYYLKGKREGMEVILQIIHDKDEKYFERLNKIIKKELSNVG